MAKYFYVDANGQKKGPVDKSQLKKLATQGIITPATPVEVLYGPKGVAGQIPDVFGPAKKKKINPHANLAFFIGVVLCVIGFVRVFFVEASLGEAFAVGFGGRSVGEIYFQRAISEPFLIIGVIAIIIGAYLTNTPFNQQQK